MRTRTRTLNTTPSGRPYRESSMPVVAPSLRMRDNLRPANAIIRRTSNSAGEILPADLVLATPLAIKGVAHEFYLDRASNLRIAEILRHALLRQTVDGLVSDRTQGNDELLEDARFGEGKNLHAALLHLFPVFAEGLKLLGAPTEGAAQFT